MREALADLTLQHREILVHVEFLDQSVARTASMLGIPPGTASGPGPAPGPQGTSGRAGGAGLHPQSGARGCSSRA
ncbi:hypothetical protein ACRAWF_15155 [Streptomyces sp. L7]